MECSSRGRPRIYCSEAHRKAHRRQFADAGGPEKRRAMLDSWRQEFRAEVYNVLAGILTEYGQEPARRAAAAVRLALWVQAPASSAGELDQARQAGELGQLAAMLDRRDPRIVAFLEECGV